MESIESTSVATNDQVYNWIDRSNTVASVAQQADTADHETDPVDKIADSAIEESKTNMADPAAEESADTAKSGHAEAILSEIEAKDKEILGPKIDEKLAQLIDVKWSRKMDQEKLKEKQDSWLRPENCQKLLVPRANREIWQKIDNSTKRADLRLSNIQKCLQLASVAMSKCADTLLFKTNCVDGDLEHVKRMAMANVDAISLLGHASKDISAIRREKLRPSLAYDMHHLSDMQYDDDHNYLFGEDLSKSVAKAKDLAKMSKVTYKKQTSSGRNYPFTKPSATITKRSGDTSYSSKGQVQGGYHKKPFLGQGHQYKNKRKWQGSRN